MLRVDEERKIPGGVEIKANVIDREIVRSVLDGPHREKFFNPLRDGENTTARLKTLHEQWKEQHVTTVFTSGVFDLMHLNHAAFLVQVKLEAAPFHFAKYHAGVLAPTWDDLSEAEKRAYCLRLLERGDLKLIVSVDGDAAVAVRKRDKGGGERPIYSWETRASDVLRLTIETEPGSFTTVVDAVTIHDDQTPALYGTAHDSIMSIGHFLQPNVWPVYSESRDILDDLEGRDAGDFPATQIVVMSPYEYYTDALLGGKFSTTKIATRLGGAAVSQV